MVRVPCIIQKSEQEPSCLCQGAARTTESPAAFLLGELSHPNDLNYLVFFPKKQDSPSSLSVLMLKRGLARILGAFSLDRVEKIFAGLQGHITTRNVFPGTEEG